MVTVVKIKKRFEDKLDVVTKYYQILTCLNNLKLSPLEIKIISFTAVTGNIASVSSKDKFVNSFDSTKTSVTKTVAKLVREGYLVRVDRKVVVNKQLLLDFGEDIILKLNMESE